MANHPAPTHGPCITALYDYRLKALEREDSTEIGEKVFAMPAVPPAVTEEPMSRQEAVKKEERSVTGPLLPGKRPVLARVKRRGFGGSRLP